MLRMYGLKNCDTCRKARKWLDAEGIGHDFVDVRADGISIDQVTGWLSGVGADTLLNRRGTTWRGLSDEEKTRGEGDDLAALLVEYPALIKRPVFETGATVLVGFADPVKAQLS